MLVSLFCLLPSTMRTTSEQITIALAGVGIHVQWYSEPMDDIYGTIEVTDDIEIRVEPNHIGICRFEKGIEKEWYHQPDSIGELIDTVQIALTDAEY